MSNTWIKIEPDFAHKAYKFPLSFVSQQKVEVYAENDMVMDRWRVFLLIRNDLNIRFRFWTISDYIMGAGFNPLETLHGGYLSLDAIELSDVISILHSYEGEHTKSVNSIFHIIEPEEYENYCVDAKRLTPGHSFFYRIEYGRASEKTRIIKISVTEPPQGFSRILSLSTFKIPPNCRDLSDFNHRELHRRSRGSLLLSNSGIEDFCSLLKKHLNQIKG